MSVAQLVGQSDDRVKDMYGGVIVLIASYLIKKKTYIPVEYCNEDKAFVGEVIAAIKAAKGVVSS